jgi:hypothetical protein
MAVRRVCALFIVILSLLSLFSLADKSMNFLDSTTVRRSNGSYTLNLNYGGIELARDEEKALDGTYGEALATAYRILVAIGEATDPKKLVPIKWAHISGMNYNTIGDSGMRFLEKFSTSAKFAVKTPACRPAQWNTIIFIKARDEDNS